MHTCIVAGAHDDLAFASSKYFQLWAFDVPLDAEQIPVMHTSLGNSVGINYAERNWSRGLQWQYTEVAELSLTPSPTYLKGCVTYTLMVVCLAGVFVFWWRLNDWMCWRKESKLNHEAPDANQ